MTHPVEMEDITGLFVENLWLDAACYFITVLLVGLAIVVFERWLKLAPLKEGCISYSRPISILLKCCWISPLIILLMLITPAFILPPYDSIKVHGLVNEIGYFLFTLIAYFLIINWPIFIFAYIANTGKRFLNKFQNTAAQKLELTLLTLLVLALIMQYPWMLYEVAEISVSH